MPHMTRLAENKNTNVPANVCLAAGRAGHIVSRSVSCNATCMAPVAVTLESQVSAVVAVALLPLTKRCAAEINVRGTPGVLNGTHGQLNEPSLGATPAWPRRWIRKGGHIECARFFSRWPRPKRLVYKPALHTDIATAKRGFTRGSILRTLSL